ncbi:MAG: DUF3800 domain-containing protein [Proteobacteria bacterium]|nr:DUF3800 domain-containing protein [Pseudomonadota bacterium]
MAVLKGYFDDSGDPCDEKHRFFAVGGYVAPVERWDRFETAWNAILSEFRVPYLHMKELNQGVGAFDAWRPKDDVIVKERTASLLGAFAKVIGESRLWGFGAVISLWDLERFNAESGRGLDAKALAIYGCALEMRRYNETIDVECVLDRMNGAHAALARAEQYGRTDNFYPFMRNFPTFIPLSKNGNTGARNTPALQAADFLAWELRKNFENKRGWFDEYNPRASDPKASGTLMEWFMKERLQHMARKGITQLEIGLPQRRSLSALADAAYPDGALWDYDAFCKCDKIRGGIWST